MMPPGLWRRLLELCASPDDRAGLVDEMETEFTRLCETTGVVDARRWYRGQVRRSMLPLLAERLRKLVTQPRTPGSLVVDVQHGVRNVIRHKSVSAFVVGTLGVASAAALASVVVLDSVLLAPLPFPDPDRLITLWNTGPSLPANVKPVSFQDLEDWRKSSRSLEALSAFTPVSATLTERGDARRLEGMRIGRDYDRVLGLKPAYGRLFNDADFQQGAEPVLVVTHEFWQREFGPQAALGNESLVLDGRPRRIVGVLPAIATMYPSAPHNFWTPLLPREGARWESSRATGWIDAVARLRAGVTLQEAEQELSSVAQGLATAYPESNRERIAMKVSSLQDTIVGAARPALLLVASATVALLIVAFGNVLHLLVAHGLNRRTEFSVRQALGAGQGRLARQTCAEATLLSLLIVAAGLGIAPLLLQALQWLPDSAVPRRGEIAIVPSALPWALGLLCVTVLAIGWPMVRVVVRAPLTVDSGSARSTGTRADRRTRSVLVAAQVGLSVLLMLGGVLFIQTLQRLQSVDLGFVSENVLAMEVTPSRTAAPTAARTLAFYRDAADRVATLPGVTRVASSTSVPFVVYGWAFGIRAHDDPGDTRHMVRVAVASPGFFDTLGVRILEGQPLSDDEHQRGESVAVVSRRLAKLLFGDAPATGQFFDYSGTRWRISGVVADVRTRAEAAAEATLYLPWHNAGLRPQAMLVRTTGGTATLESISLRIRETDPQATIAEAGLLSDRIGKTLAPQRFRANLLAGLSVLAAVLAVLGAYSVTAFAVASGRREQAIRLALGERVGEAQRRVIFGAVRPAALGVAAGLAVAWYARRFVDAFLFETSATQLGLLAIPAAVLVLVALAALIPASRLSNLDPASVFRQDR